MKNLFKIFTVFAVMLFALAFTGCDNGSGESKYAAPLVYHDVKITASDKAINSGSTVTLTASDFTETTIDYNEDENGITTTESVSFDGYGFDWSYPEEDAEYITEPGNKNTKTFTFKGINNDADDKEVTITLKIKNSDGTTLCFAIANIDIRPAASN